jgi:hypothetical protein
MNNKFKIIFFCLVYFCFLKILFPYNNLYKNKEKKRYIVYECTTRSTCGGWADRLKGIMSAYAIGLLTDRHLLIHFTRPCNLTNFLEPNKHNWLKTNYLSKRSKKIWKLNLDNFSKSLKYNNEFDSNAKYLSIKSNLDWIKNLNKNKIYQEIIQRKGFDLNNFELKYMFKNWYSKLFKLNARLNEKYLKFLKIAKPNNETKLICAQIRVGGKRPNVEFDAVFITRNKTKIYWNYIRQHFIKNLTDYRIFITSDTKDVEQEAIKEFGKDFVLFNDGLNYHLDRIESLELNFDILDKIFLDFHSLQNCDMAFISSSGFGRLGTWNRVNPNKNLVMLTFDNDKISNETDENY